MNESGTNTLGLRIQTGRKAAGLSQEALGEQLGVSRQAVSKWEADAAIPELENLIAMSKLFGMSIGALLGVEKEEEPSLSERELQAAQAIAEKYAEQITPQPQPRRRALLAAVLVCSVAIGAVQWWSNRRVSGLNQQLVGMQMQINNIQNDVSNQLNDFTSQLHLTLEEQSRNIFHSSVKLIQFDLKNETVTVNATATAKEWNEATTGQFTATFPDGSMLTADAIGQNGVFSVQNWVLPRENNTDFNAQFSLTLRDSNGSQTSPIDFYPIDANQFRLPISASLSYECTFSGQPGNVTLNSIHITYGDSPLVLNQYPTALDLCAYRNNDTTPEKVIPLSYVVKHIQNSPFEITSSLSDVFTVESGDVVCFALRFTDNLGHTFYLLLDAFSCDEEGILTDLVSMPERETWIPGENPEFQFGRR